MKGAAFSNPPAIDGSSRLMELRQLGNGTLLLANPTSAGSGSVWCHRFFTGDPLPLIWRVTTEQNAAFRGLLRARLNEYSSTGSSAF